MSLPTNAHIAEDSMAVVGQFDEPEWMDDNWKAQFPDNKGPLFLMRERLSYLDLSDRVRKDQILSTQGGYSDVYFGTYESADGQSYSVAVKQLRVHIVEARKLQRSLARELYTWSRLNHPNILPFYGFYIENDIYPNLVAPCMKNGTVMSYLESNPAADVVSLVKGIAEGIRYLHANGIVHSDIKPANVLISDSGEPRICDFGVSRILGSSVSFQTSTSNTARGTLRYMAKEIILVQDGESYSKQADVWAFGMTVYTIITKHQPYHHILVDAAVMLEIYNGKLPSWPEDSKMWPPASRMLTFICESCWLKKLERPTMEEISSSLDILTKRFPEIACLDMMRPQLRFNICDVESSYLGNSDLRKLESRIKNNISNALQFAGLHWVDFALQTDISGATRAAITDFLSSLSILYWVELLSLLGQLETGKAMLQKCINHFESQSRISLLATEWCAFISIFYDAISISAPHIYISALSWGAPSSLKCLSKHRLLASDDYVTSKPSNDEHKAIPDLRRNVWNARCASISPDKSKFAFGGDDGSLQIWDAVEAQFIRHFETHKASQSSSGGKIKAHDGSVYDVKFSPDARRVVTGSRDSTLRVWDAQTGQLVVGPLRGHTDTVQAVAYSPDGARIVSGGKDRTLRIWDAQTGIAVGGPLIGHDGVVTAVSYSPDGRRIASASYDETLRIWDAYSGKQIGEPLRGHYNWVTCMAFSADGKRIVSGSYDTTVRIWDTQTGQEVGEPLKGRHRGSVQSVSYTLDGGRIVSGSPDNTLRIWDARAGNAIGVISRRGSCWDSDRGCFLSIPPWWPEQSWLLITASLMCSDAPTQVPDDGWLRTLNGNLFLWVPPEYREDVCCRGPMSNIPPRLNLDWRKVPHGKDWTKVKEMLEEPIEQESNAVPERKVDARRKPHEVN